jgi:hypothetical protein
MKNAIFEMWRRVVFVWTDVSEKFIATIFRVEKSATEEPASGGGRREPHDSGNVEVLLSILSSYFILGKLHFPSSYFFFKKCIKFVHTLSVTQYFNTEINIGTY